MVKARYLVVALALSVVLLASFVVAAQNYTLVILKIHSDGNVLTYDDLDSFEAFCNDQPYVGLDVDSEMTYIAFDSSQCDDSDEIIFTAKLNGKQDYSGDFDVESCNGDEVCSNVSDEFPNGVLNYAFGFVNLVDAPVAPVEENNGGSRRSGGGSSKKVTKNLTVTSAPITVENTALDDGTENGAETGAENGAETGTEEMAGENDEEIGALTGGVIGTVREYSFIIALLFIAGILVAYMYVRKRRSSYSKGFY